MIKRYFFPVLGIVLSMAACRSSQPAEKTVVKVKTQVAQEYGGELKLTYPGRIKAAADVDLSFRVAGPIIRIPADVGRFVRRGEPVAEIDPRDYELQFKATEAEYKQIKAEAERVIALHERKSVSVNDYDKAVAGLRQITAKYAAHKNALQDTRLLAPFDGYIQKKYFDVNETVAAGMPVISMIDTRYFEVEIDIPSSDYIRQDRFRHFSCVADIFPEKNMPLELIDITKKANLNQLYRMRLRLRPEPGVPVAAGMSVNVTVECDPNEEHSTRVPFSAVFEEGGNSYVWVYRAADKKVERRAVNVRQVLKDGSAVLGGGVQPGEPVVTAGVRHLQEGMTVDLLKPVSRTNVGGLL